MKNQVLTALEWDADGGSLTFNQVRYLLIRPETLAEFQKAVEAELGERAGELIYVGGFTGGSLSAQRYKEVFGYDERESVEFMCRMGGQLGWGRFELVELDVAQKRLAVEVVGSPFAGAYGPSARGVCHLIRGVLGGLGAGLFGGDVVARETRCLATGDASCRFVVEGK